MDTTQKVSDFIRKAVAELAGQPAEAISPDQQLIGDAAVLNSRDLVVLMLDVEEFLETEFGASFNWTSDSALSGTRSRLRTVGSLTDLVTERAGADEA